MKKISLVFIFIISLTFTAFAQVQQEKSVTVFGAKIRYVEAGDATKPKVILLHGLGSSAESWQFNVAFLAKAYHVIAPDQVGFGKSDKPALAYRIGTFVDFFDKFLSELKIEKASLVGNSLGGWVAASYALKYPNKVEKVVLVDAAGFAPPKDFDLRVLQGLNPSTRDQVRATFKLVFYNQALITDSVVDAAITQRVLTGDGNTIQAITESVIRGEDFLDNQLQNLKKPTLIIWGKQDGLITVDNGERFNREIAGSQIIVFDKCGHVPQIEKALDFNQAVLKFLEAK